MPMTGRCYCGNLEYEVEGDPVFKGQCHCRECQYVSGGAPNMALGMADAGFRYTKGTPKVYQRADLDSPVAREFCGDCGTQIASRPPSMGGTVILKVGTLDDPSVFGQPQMAIYLCDKQPFHQVPEGIATFDRVPG